MFQIEEDFWPDVESPTDPPENSTIGSSSESLAVDSEFLQLRRANNGCSFAKGRETTQWGVRDIWM